MSYLKQSHFETLTAFLSIKRRHESIGVKVASNLIKEKCDGFCSSVEVDKAGNIRAVTDSTSKTLFVAHVDTMHSDDGYTNLVTFKCANGINYIAADNSVLGADDGAGVALLLTLIENEVPGTYLFTQGEERGGIGAKYTTQNDAKFYSKFDRVICFDRRGTDSVITHQSVGRTCSDVFANALASALNDQCSNFFYSPDDSGVYTDSAEFAGIVPECTNISVGYYSEHSTNEMLDSDHWNDLVLASLRIDWESLPVSRKAGDFDLPDYFGGAYDNWNGFASAVKNTKTKTKTKTKIKWQSSWGQTDYYNSLYSMTREQAYDYCFADPEAFVDLVFDSLNLDVDHYGK